MAGEQGFQTRDFHSPWIARHLHAIPHIDMSFHRANSTFNLENAKYRESLLFWSAVPVLWLVLTLLVFLIYFCYRCCQRGVEKRQRAPCLRWSMAVLIMLSCGAIGVGFYGNEDTNKGIVRWMSAVDDAMHTVNKIKNQMQKLQMSINETMASGIEGLKNVYKAHPELNQGIQQDVRNYTIHSLRLAYDIFANVAPINEKSHRVELTQLGRLEGYAKRHESYRWKIMMGALSWPMFFSLLLLVGVGMSSKCILLLYCAFSIFTLVVWWNLTGLHLTVAVGVSDFCVSPHAFANQLVANIEQDTLNYYIRCDANLAPNPFKRGLQSASDNIKESNTSLNRALDIAYKFIPPNEISPHVRVALQGLNEAREVVMLLMALLDCTNLHKYYMDALDGVCHMSLPGIVFIMSSTAATSLLFSILIILSSRAWRTFGADDYICYEEDLESAAAIPATMLQQATLSSNHDDVFLPNDYFVTLPRIPNRFKKACVEDSDKLEPFLSNQLNDCGSAAACSTSRSHFSCSRGHQGNEPMSTAAAINRRTTPPPAVSLFPPVGFGRIS